MSDFLGRGWAFRTQLDRLGPHLDRLGRVALSSGEELDRLGPHLDRGRVALSSGEEKVEQSIFLILGTRIGERVMRPTFGSRLHELLFAPSDARSLGLAEKYVIDALRFWEPRIELVDVHAANDAEDQALIVITVLYRIKSRDDERSLVYPFYRIPGELGPGA